MVHPELSAHRTEFLKGFVPQEVIRRMRDVNGGFDPGVKLRPAESLFLQNVIPGIACNSIIASTKEGYVLPIEVEGEALMLQRNGDRVLLGTGKQGLHGPVLADFHREYVSDVTDYIGVPINGYGPHHIMLMCAGPDRSEALVDVQPTARRHRLRRYQQGILEGLLDLQKGSDVQTVYWLENHSRGVIDGQPVDATVEGVEKEMETEALGHESIQGSHSHMVVLDDTVDGEPLNNQSPERILERRAGMVWDGGPSEHLGAWVVAALDKTIDAYCAKAGLGKPKKRADPLGFTILIPGFTTRCFGDPVFEDELWRPICHTVFYGQSQWEEVLYPNGKLPQVIAHQRAFQQQVAQISDKEQQRRLLNDFLQERKRLFTRRSPPLQDTVDHRRLNEFADAGVNRVPMSGWSGTIQLQRYPDGEAQGLIAVVINPVDGIHCGGVESMGLGMVRTADYYEIEEKERNRTEAIRRGIVYHAVGHRR